MQTYHVTLRGTEIVPVTLLSIAEYEKKAGKVTKAQHEIGVVCGMSIPNFWVNSVDMREMGIADGSYEYDEQSDLFLLYEWPDLAPVDVRCNVA